MVGLATFSFPTTIVFGVDATQELPRRLAGLGVSRPLIVTDPGLAEAPPLKSVTAVLGSAPVIFSGVHPNPIEEDVESAAKAYAEGRCDGVIGVGGGSALDVAKAMRLRVKRPEKSLREFDFDSDWTGLAPFVAIPTTAGTGSEVGRSAVITIDRVKRLFFHPKLLADLVILDPKLTIGLPPKLTAATGADALTHCIEAATSTVFHPMCEAIALEGIRMIVDALPRATKDGSDLDARGKMQLAAMMGGVAFQKDLGATHSLAHPLSALCGMHHGTANALCLPFVMSFNASRKPSVYQHVGEAMGLRDACDEQVVERVKSLLASIGLPPGLRAYGVDESKLDALADQAFADACHQTNPVPVTRDDLYQLYKQAL